jgi:hypothetical protein
MKRFHSLLFFFIFVLFSLNVFSRNSSKNAVVFIDGNPETEGISPPLQRVIEGEVFTIAVVAENVRDLHTYSFKCQFDTQVVSFNRAVAKLTPTCTAFLEQRNGSIAAFLSLPDTNSIEIAATMSGKDTTQSVSGNGALGFLSFTAKKTGNPALFISDIRLVTPDGTSIPAEVNKQ